MKLRIATKEDWKVLLDWRNDPLTRKNSINSDIISEFDHKKWFFESLENPYRTIYLVEEGENLIGTLRTDTEKNITIISWTVAPDQRGKGFAKRMVKNLADKLNGLLEAIVKEQNIASVKVAEYAGFSLFKKKKDILIFRRNNNENK